MVSRGRAWVRRSAPALLAGCLTILSAQGTQTSTVALAVVDKAFAPLGGATIVLTSENLQGPRQGSTDGRGLATFRLLPPGPYSASISHPGHYSATIHFHVGLDQTLAPRVILAAEGPGATVEVADRLAWWEDKAEFALASRFDHSAIEALPVDPGTSLDIAYLVPGTARSANAAQGEISIRGAQGSGNLVMVDGQNVMDNLWAGQRIGTIFEAVAETQVLTGALPASYGWVEGGVINQVTRSGGNRFTGSLRLDLSDLAWNARAPHQDPGSVPDERREGWTWTLGGPLLKDKLWFFLAGYDQHPSQPMAFAAPGPAASALGSSYIPPSLPLDYTQRTDDRRFEGKLTWSPDADDTFIATYNESRNAYNRNADGAGEPAALSMFTMLGDFCNLAWNRQIQGNLTLSVRYGQKHQRLVNALNPQQYTDGIVIGGPTGAYGSAMWDAADPAPDTRDNTTWSIQATAFLAGAGSHELTLGIDSYRGAIKASGYGSSGRIDVPGIGNGLNLAAIYVDNYDAVNRTFAWVGEGGFAASMYVLQYVPDRQDTDLRGGFLNDRWVLDTHWNFNLGVRYDAYEVESASRGRLASAHAFSPRLGLTWDPLGDARFLGNISFNRLQGRPLEGQFSNADYVNHPKTFLFAANGSHADSSPGNPATWYPVAALVNQPASWFNLSLAPGSFTFSDPVLGTQVDPHLKPQQVDEIQGNLTWNFRSVWSGAGSVRIGAMRKHWSNLVDYSVGNAGTVRDGFGQVQDITYWHNEPSARRDYRDLELGVKTVRGPLSVQVDVLWSRLTGNYVGELPGGPGIGQGLNFYTTYQGRPQYSAAEFNPVGTLVTPNAQAPLAINGHLSYAVKDPLGSSTLGLVYRFLSGQHYDQERNVPVGTVAPDLPAGSYAGSEYISQFLGGARGTGVYQASAYLDLALRQDILLSRAIGPAPTFFLKISVSNLFNHQQRLTWIDGYQDLNPGDPVSSAFVRRSDAGAAPSDAYFGTARSLQFAAGVQF